jgi:hypothetical protein
MTQMDAASSEAPDQITSPGSPTTCTYAKTVHKFTLEERTATRTLARYCLEKHPTVIRAFQAVTAEVAKRAHASGYNWVVLAKHELKIVAAVLSGDMEKATDLTADGTMEMVQHFWPDCQEPIYLELLKERVASRSSELTQASAAAR